MTDALRHPDLPQTVGVLRPGDCIRDALGRIEAAEPKICLILDDEGRLLRTLTDGDVRRGLLGGLSLEDAIAALPGGAPVHAHHATPAAELSRLIREARVAALVLVDDQRRPVGLRTLDQLEGPILLSSPHIGDAEARYVQDAFDTNWIAPAGPNLALFEERLAAISGRRQAVAVSSGTAGLHLAVRALEIPRAARVYVADKTFAATLQPLLYEGITPVLIDCEPFSWNMSAQALERALQRDSAAGTLPRAIIVVHLYGQSADMQAIMELADRYGIPVIEDAAESLGARYGARPSGGHGLVSVYSFNGNKIITTSGGGAVVTDVARIADRLRYLSTQGRDPFDHYQHSEIAYNYRMSNILAGVGLGQLEVLSDRVDRRRAVFQRYHQALSVLPGIGFQNDFAQARGNRWLTVVTFDPEAIDLHPYQIMRALRARGIETRPSWKPMHMQPLLSGAQFVPHSDQEAVSSRLFLQALCLPSGSNMRPDQQERVIELLLETISKGRN